MMSKLITIISISTLLQVSNGIPIPEGAAASPVINVSLGQIAALSPDPALAKATLLEKGLQIFRGPPLKLDHTILEEESLLSKVDSTYTFLHEIFANLFQYKPIVDTIQEHEKYGNDNEKFRGLGNIAVQGAASLGNLLNTVIELPQNLFKKAVKSANEKLNHLGGKLVGLE